MSRVPGERFLPPQLRQSADVIHVLQVLNLKFLDWLHLGTFNLEKIII